MKRVSLLIAVALVTQATSISAREPRSTFAGPLHYCGTSFALDLKRGERMNVREGEDFIVHYIGGDSHFGIYEGNYPQNGIQGELVEVGLSHPVKRLQPNKDGIEYHSYLVRTGLTFPAYAHVWSERFDGTAASTIEFRLGSRASVRQAHI